MVVYDASIYNLSTRLGFEQSGSATEATNAATFTNPVQVHARLDLLVAVLLCDMHLHPFHIHSHSLACDCPHPKHPVTTTPLKCTRPSRVRFSVSSQLGRL
jgi:hypothetical protein